MNALESENLIDSNSRINLLENKIVLASTQSNPAKIESFADLAADKLTLIALGLWDKLNREHKISFAGNVTEAALQIKEGAVDCGIIYATDAALHALKVTAYPPAGKITMNLYPLYNSLRVALGA